jgi:predicted PurR-regulated permease PerM
VHDHSSVRLADDADGPVASRHALRARIQEWGVTCWRLVGIIVAVFLVYTTLVVFNGLVVPLLFAGVAAALGVPVVDRLERARLPRPAAAIVLIVLVVAAIAGAFAIVVRGIVDDSAEIRDSVVAGADSVRDWTGTDADGSSTAAAYESALDQAWPWLGGAASWATSIFSSALTFGIGIFLGLFMLYYMLVDWRRVTTWLSRHLGLTPELGAAVIGDATTVVRRGFAALTVTSLITSSLIGLSMLLLDIPLALSVAIVTFITSYIPYFGAILSGAFGFLVALGASGRRDAFILLIIILVVQNIVQTLVSNRLASEALNLHPLPSIISSVAGVAIAGLVGAILSAPALALAIAVQRRLGVARAQLGVRDPVRAGPPGLVESWSTHATTEPAG